LADGVAKEDDDGEDAEGGAEGDVKAVEAGDDDGKNAMPTLTKEKAGKDVQCARSDENYSHEKIEPDEHVEKFGGRLRSLDLPSLGVHEDLAENEVMDTKECYAEKGEAADDEVKYG
jgi:hypothetical protein